MLEAVLFDWGHTLMDWVWEDGLLEDGVRAGLDSVGAPPESADPLAEEFRIYESRTAGADAVLLPASAVPAQILTRLIHATTSTHMTACVACATAEEISAAAAARAPVIALEAKDLHLAVPPRTLVLALSFTPAARGRADAALDPSLSDAAAFRRALSEEDP